jgi:hypothetical protein
VPKFGRSCEKSCHCWCRVCISFCVSSWISSLISFALHLLGVFYAIHVAVEGCRTCMLLLLLFKLILIFSVVLRFGFPLLLSPDVLSDLKSLFTLLLVVSYFYYWVDLNLQVQRISQHLWTYYASLCLYLADTSVIPGCIVIQKDASGRVLCNYWKIFEEED